MQNLVCPVCKLSIRCVHAGAALCCPGCQGPLIPVELITEPWYDSARRTYWKTLWLYITWRVIKFVAIVAFLAISAWLLYVYAWPHAQPYVEQWWEETQSKNTGSGQK